MDKAQRDAAIVTPVPGTTRDILELSLDIGGLPVIVSDTAGIRKTDDLVESIGVQRAKTASVAVTDHSMPRTYRIFFRIQDADISLCVLSLPGAITQTIDGSRVHVPTTLKPLIAPGTFLLFNKSDLAPTVTPEVISRSTGAKSWMVSLRTGEGTADFLSGFASALQERYVII